MNLNEKLRKKLGGLNKNLGVMANPGPLRITTGAQSQMLIQIKWLCA